MPEEKDINDYSDLVDGGDEKVVEADDKVSPAGEIIPENMKPVETEIVEPVKVEEPPKEVIPETTDETPENPYDARFKELGLDTQFKGGVEEMLSKQPATNKYITDLEKERNDWKDMANRTQPEAKTEATPTGDDLYNDPLTVVNKIVDSKMTDVNAKLVNLEAQQFIASKKDYKEIEPLMMAEAREHPGLAAMGVNAIPILYKLAKTEQLTKLLESKKAESTPATQKEKANAATTTGKKEVTPDKDSMAHWEGKSLKEMEAEIGVIPEQ